MSCDDVLQRTDTSTCYICNQYDVLELDSQKSWSEAGAHRPPMQPHEVILDKHEIWQGSFRCFPITFNARCQIKVAECDVASPQAIDWLAAS
jgi:hypothetical protein